MKPNPIHISAVINTRNESKHLKKCITSIKNLVDEIIVVDMESSDDTIKIAESCGAKVISHPWLPVVEPARNFGIQKAKGEWILLLDPDERLTKELRTELKKVSKRTDIQAVRIPRKNIIFGRWMRHGKMWPDYLIRFFKKGAVTWKNEIHSQPEIHGQVLTLIDNPETAIKHFNYSGIYDFLHKAIRYSNKQAEELHKSGYKVKVSDFILKPLQEFNSRYFATDGYKDGLHGLIFALLQTSVEILIYARLWEIQGSQDRPVPKESFVSASQQAMYEFGHWFSLYFVKEYSKNPIKRLLIKLRQILNRVTKNY